MPSFCWETLSTVWLALRWALPAPTSLTWPNSPKTEAGTVPSYR